MVGDNGAAETGSGGAALSSLLSRQRSGVEFLTAGGLDRCMSGDLTGLSHVRWLEMLLAAQRLTEKEEGGARGHEIGACTARREGAEMVARGRDARVRIVVAAAAARARVMMARDGSWWPGSTPGRASTHTHHTHTHQRSQRPQVARLSLG